MRLHIHFPPAKPHAFSFQPQPLFNGRISSQLDGAASSQDPLPLQAKSTAQHPGYHPCRSRKPRYLRHSTVCRNLPARNRPDRALNAQHHHSRWRWFLLRFGHLTKRASPKLEPALKIRNNRTVGTPLLAGVARSGDFEFSRVLDVATMPPLGMLRAPHTPNHAPQTR